MKKGFRILSWIGAAIFVLLLGIIVAIQSPAVQTELARKAIDKFADKIDGDIEVGSISIRPFDALVLKDVAVIDRNPYSDGSRAPMDTLLRVGNVSARFSLRGLFFKEPISVSRLRLEDAEFNLVLEPKPDGSGTQDNLSRILRLGPSDPDKPQEDFGNLLKARKVDVVNVTFRMINHEGIARELERGADPLPGNVIDWNDLEAHADIHATNVVVKDGDISGEAQHIRISDKTGLSIEDLSGKVKVGHGQVLLDNLHIQDPDSDLHLRYLRLLGTLGDDYPEFVNRVRIEGEITQPSVISMQTVSHFAPNLDKMTFRGELSGRMEGTVSDFTLKGFTFNELASGVQGRVNGSMRGLPDIENTVMDFKLNDFRFGLGGIGTFIREWAPDTDLDLSKLGKGTEFNLDATAKGTLNRLAVQGNLNSNAGAADVDLTLRNVIDQRRDIAIGGTVRTRDLDAGRIAGIDALGPVTLTTGVNATLAPGNLQVSIDSLKVSRLQALGYDYTGIAAVGKYSDQSIDGRIICDDPNLNFLLQGTFDLSPQTRNAAYRFYANVGYADLNALNIDKRGPSKISLEADANFIRTPNRDILGEVNLRDVTLENAAGRHEIGDITASAHANDNIHRMRLVSTFAEGTYIGEKSLVAMIDDLKELVVRKELPALLTGEGKPWDGTPYAVRFTFHDTHDLLEFILPGLYIEKNTDIRLQVDRDGLVEGSIHSGRLALGTKYLKDFKLDLNNRDDAVHATLSGSAINLGGIELLGNQLVLGASDNHFGLTYSFDNQTEAANQAEFRLSGALDRDEEGLIVSADILPSSIYYEGNRWDLDSEELTLRGSDLRVNSFRISNGPQNLVVDGGLSPSRADTLSVRMDRFDISLLNTFLMEGKLKLRGRATGRARLVSPSKPSLALLAGITCDSTSIAGRPMGQLMVGSTWNEAEDRFDFRLRNQQGEVRNLDVNGFLRPKDKAIQAEATLNRLDLGYASPFLDGVFHRFGGGLDGKVRVDGTLDKLKIASEGMQIVDGVIGIEFTNVTYGISGPISVDTEGLRFSGVNLTDNLGGSGSVTGSILFGGFKDLRLDTHVRFNELKVLGITNRNNPIYGDAYASGRVDITGPLDALALNVEARTTKEGDLHIPLGGGSAKATGDLLVFKQPAVEVEEDPYEKMLQAHRTSGKKQSHSNLDIRVRVRANPSVTAWIDIGENSLRGQGSGLIDLRIRTAQNQFTINGDYTLSQGDFRFSALNVVTRDFSIRDGSSIRFNGEVMDSDLNVTGVYTTKADISTLLSSSLFQSGGSRRQVDCLIGITDKLRNPKISFNIEIPELDPGTEGLVQSALNTEDKVMKQFLYLLIANSFLPNEESGIMSTGSTNMLYSNMTGIMAGQLNSIFQKLDIPLDLGLNYQQNSSGNNLFDVALSTQLFNNRVIVNGAIGNRRVLGTTTDEVAGDLDIGIKLNQAGTFRLNLFSHSADQYTSFLDNSQRNGVGVAYQREFNTFRQFFRELSTPRREREERPMPDAQQPFRRRYYLQIDSLGKAHPVTVTNE